MDWCADNGYQTNWSTHLQDNASYLRSTF
jgi:hypothetical protein